MRAKLLAKPSGLLRRRLPLLGATIESVIYRAEDQIMTVVNRSTVEAEFTLEAGGGWQVEPAILVLDPGERADVTVSVAGEDGAAIDVRAPSAAESPRAPSGATNC